MIKDINSIITDCECSRECLTYEVGEDIPEWIRDLEGNGVIVISDDSIRYHGKYGVEVAFFRDYISLDTSTGEVTVLQRTDLPIDDKYYQDSLESELDYSEEVDTP